MRTDDAGIKHEETKSEGYVYILEVKGFDLRVCKIGRTLRDPEQRCAEINRSSTGDFIWSVAHSVSVDDCKTLESLVHDKLLPLRQKGREFFHVYPDDAFTALSSILESEPAINHLPNFREDRERKSNSRKSKSRQLGRGMHGREPEYAELFDAFNSILNVKGRLFGQTNKPEFGISDDNRGVQWNLSVNNETGIARLGVNLEGMKYMNWPIADFIVSELTCASLDDVREKLTKPADAILHFSRDAWQATARPSIVEEYIGGRDFPLAEIDSMLWKKILTEALKCLDEDKDYRGRARQLVTLSKRPKDGSQHREMDVSPHFRIYSNLQLDGGVLEGVEEKIHELKPVYDWVKEKSGSG